MLCRSITSCMEVVYQNSFYIYTYFFVWRDMVRRLVTDPVVMHLSPVTGHICCALLAN